MDTTNTQVMSIRLSSEELQKIDAGAAASGMNRPDYARSKLLAPAIEMPANNLEARLEQIEALVKHALCRIDQVYDGIFSIAEDEGKLSTEQLKEIHDRILEQTVRHATKLPESLATMQAKIAEASKKEKA
jgi:hypothetical protein